eukprot:CAMPEP_0170479140 /NCGR_PEP_ID=MMETSP0208-20121228/475_1 /TAXON_ID=197538 /ORGANISM="Strombidium inclinatum, Strain S3" /LENGTH=394 /DNA_ID=CAMNT_0010751485 /DNA_START=72 /DNA_END=1253 /DNA_ORIENTATION=-
MGEASKLPRKSVMPAPKHKLKTVNEEGKPGQFRNFSKVIFEPDDFMYCQHLGEGAFGKVRLCEINDVTRLENGDSTTSSGSEGGDSPVPLQNKVLNFDTQDKTLAVKLQSKYQLIKNKQVDHLYNEATLMAKLEHPFILQMKGISQDKRVMYIYLEYMKCGDLMEVVNKFRKLDPALARFYVAQIVLCFEYLHGKNMVYRDLKPENVLLNSNGYIKMADFGFLKQLSDKDERTFTFCGTPEYIAPEIFLNKGYSQPVDWYALGIFMYELLVGRPPFMASNPMEIFKKVMEQKLLFPKDIDKDAKSLIKKLCDHDLSKRYGNLKNGVDDIKNHRFFKKEGEEIDWEALSGMRSLAAYIPRASSKANDKESPQEAKVLQEANDNVKFPPIKETKDP